MTQIHTHNKKTEAFDIDYVVQALRGMLPNIAHDLVVSRHDAAESRQLSFGAAPDSAEEHSPLWHQYGILTHSEEFQRIMQTELYDFIEQWGVLGAVQDALSEKVEGASKADLLQIVSLLHDLGKFTARIFEKQEDGVYLARFHGHEINSGVIVRTVLKGTLQDIGLHNGQIEYIAKCVEHHFELGKARRAAIDNGGYSIEYAKSAAFRKMAQGIIKANPGLSLEIGLMFIADSLSKTELMAVADNDEDIARQKSILEKKIQVKALDPRLINQALQQPVNIEIGKQYLQVWVGGRST